MIGAVRGVRLQFRLMAFGSSWVVVRLSKAFLWNDVTEIVFELFLFFIIDKQTPACLGTILFVCYCGSLHEAVSMY